MKYQEWDHAYQALIKSNVADRHGFDNTPGKYALKCLKNLWWNLLKPIEEKIHPHKISISSGYRCLFLNRAIKSDDTSQHRKGQAFDFECFSMSNIDLFHFIKERFDFDQLILEFYNPKKGPNSGWVHCSYVSKEANRNHAFSIKG